MITTDLRELRDKFTAKPETRFRSHMGESRYETNAATIKRSESSLVQRGVILPAESSDRDLIRRIVRAIDAGDAGLLGSLYGEARELIGESEARNVR